MKYAYVTLLSSVDYLPAILILHQNLKDVQSRYPLLVAVTENIANNVIPYLKNNGILYKIIPFLEYTEQTKQYWEPISKTVLNIASKFILFKFYEYDKLVYIDSDIVIYNNIDDLFDYPDGALYDDFGRPFIGLFVFCPKNHCADYYYTLSRVYHCIESDILEPLFFPFKSNPDYRIPYQYYLNIMNENFANLYYDAKVIHFCYKFKPWFFTNVQDYKNQLLSEFPNFTEPERFNIVQSYLNQYVLPLIRKYPEFTPGGYIC